MSISDYFNIEYNFTSNLTFWISNSIHEIFIYYYDNSLHKTLTSDGLILNLKGLIKGRGVTSVGLNLFYQNYTQSNIVIYFSEDL